MFNGVHFEHINFTIWNFHLQEGLFSIPIVFNYPIGKFCYIHNFLFHR